MSDAIVVPSLEDLLQRSSASREFRAAVLEFARTQRADGRIHFPPGNPPVKVLRAICGLLEKHPDLEIDSVAVDARSGCSDFRGHLLVNGGARRFHFVWDCAWKAREMGWKDHFGDPDQIRAARTFGYQCFEKFEEVAG